MSAMLRAGLVLMVAGAGCASTPVPSELATARATYDRARFGQAADLDPADLHVAKKALDRAEESFDEDGDTRPTRDLAYVATRRAQIAEARASAIAATHRQQETIASLHDRQAAQLRAANQQLSQQELDAANQRNAETEKRLQETAAALAKYATVKQDARGTVITLSGGVLFPSGKSTLPAPAQAKLDTVANALTKQDPDSKLVIEGHTDSQGSQDFNQQLSKQRAEAVRDYLVSKGIAADRIKAEGYGSSQSIADNDSPEGRATNRRVEIVVEAKNDGQNSAGSEAKTPQP